MGFGPWRGPPRRRQPRDSPDLGAKLALGGPAPNREKVVDTLRRRGVSFAWPAT